MCVAYRVGMFKMILQIPRLFLDSYVSMTPNHAEEYQYTRYESMLPALGLHLRRTYIASIRNSLTSFGRPDEPVMFIPSTAIIVAPLTLTQAPCTSIQAIPPSTRKMPRTRQTHQNWVSDRNKSQKHKDKTTKAKGLGSKEILDLGLKLFKALLRRNETITPRERN